MDGGTYRLGRVLPVKFALTLESAGVTDLAATLTLHKLSDGVGGTPIDAEAAGNADTGNRFRYDPTTGQYVFNLATRELTEGTWLLVVTLGDGQARTLRISLAR